MKEGKVGKILQDKRQIKGFLNITDVAKEIVPISDKWNFMTLKGSPC